MTLDSLNHLRLDTEFIRIRREPATKSVATFPRNQMLEFLGIFDQRRFDNARQIVVVDEINQALAGFDHEWLQKNWGKKELSPH